MVMVPYCRVRVHERMEVWRHIYAQTVVSSMELVAVMPAF